MKKFLALSTTSLFFFNLNSFKPVNAQLSCQNAVDLVARDIRNRRTNIHYEIKRNESPIRSNRRRDGIIFYLNYKGSVESGRVRYVAENILYSRLVMKSYANQIFVRCGGTGFISFGLHSTDWNEDFIMTDDGTLGYEACGEDLRRNTARRITNIYYQFDYPCAYVSL